MRLILTSMFALPAFALLCLSGPAKATDALAPAPAMALSVDPAPLPSDELGDISAGEGVTNNVISNQDLTATNSGNTINAGSVQNGDITFSGNALSGFNGVGNFVSNTGNNNNLQGSISINITGMPGVP
jgi:hypothetical protein